MRQMSDMSEVEKAQFRNHKAILDSSLSTVEELKLARNRLDALMWKGQTGPIMELVSKLTVRLDNVEEQGQSMSNDDRKAIVELRKLAKRLDATKIDAIEASVSKCLNDFAEFVVMETQHHDDAQSGWSRHEATFVEARIKRQAILKGFKEFEQKANDKFYEVEKKVDDLQLDLNTVIAHAIDEAKTAIMAEAERAAITAVANLLGESHGVTTQKADKP